MAERACCGQRTSNTSPGIGEDQHAGNTNKTTLPGRLFIALSLKRLTCDNGCDKPSMNKTPGTRRHDCGHDRSSPVTSKDAGQLG